MKRNHSRLTLGPRFWIVPTREDPQTPEPWENVLDGTGEGAGPVQNQMGRGKIIGDENCLFVNVFTKDLNPPTPKPVMVWIHGGGFAVGSTSRDMYSPDYLMSKDIVLVSIAYRVGMFGFLSLNDPSLKIPGNAGLRDQILALKWIQQNITRFGGDRNNVTIFGESAGGAAVHMLGLTDQTKGLFHRMICLSGSVLCNWATPARKDWLSLIIKELGYSGEQNEQDMLKFLRTVDAKKIAAAETKVVTKEDQYEGYYWTSYPVVEPYVSEQCVLAKDPVELARNAWSNEIPMITGCTSREGITFRDFTEKGVYKAWQEDPVLMLPFDLKSNADPVKCKELAERVKKEHFGDAEITTVPYMDEPQAPESWTTVLDCTSEASKPVQVEYYIEKAVGSEDCLYINVYTKDVNPTTPRPVIVWIHGGGFVRGTTSKDIYSPDYFMSKDIVFVSIAYRVGLFGFLSMMDPSLKVPGNGGLKDLIFGLKWVKDNISKFGGDPNNVTLFGESAGASAVHILAVSEQSKGLFHKMICMSGAAISNVAPTTPKNWTIRIAQDLGYTGPNSEAKILSFLRKTDCKRIAMSEAKIVSNEERLDGYMWCSYPVIEPFITAQCVISQHPLILARNTWSNEVPMIAGCTSREGIFFGNFKPPGAFEEWAKNPSLLLPFDLKQDPNSAHCWELGDRLKNASFESGKLTYESFIDEPQTPEPWTTVLDGTAEASKPVQTDYIERIVGSEDCLYVNVYTRDIKPTTPRPVIVWIHGGGFVRGSTSKDVYSPDYFMSKDIVFVSVAYRLGLFGCLSMVDPSLRVPGNGGLKDQILGLKWVKDNISRFGGDPNNITLFGESAGAAAVHILAISEQSKGLFHKMICMSGSAFSYWTLPPLKNWAIRIAQDLGYTGPNNEARILAFLRKANAKKLALAEAKVVSKRERLDGYMWCSYPVIEPYITAQCVIPQNPLIMARNAWSNELPMIAGGTSREGIFFANLKPPGSFEEWTKNPSLLLPFDLKQDPNSEHCQELGDRLKKASFESGEFTKESFTDFLTFKIFWHSMHRMVQSRQKYAKAPTYMYLFEFDSPKHALMKTLASIKVPGVSHGDDMGYFFNNMIVPETKPGSPERQKIEQFIAMWAQFAQNDDPNCAEIAPIKWEPVAADEKPHKLLRIGGEIKFEENPFAETLEFWDGLYEDGKLI